MDESISKRMIDVLDIFKQQFGESHVDFVRESNEEIYDNNENSYITSVYFVVQYIRSYAAAYSIILKVDKETVTNETGCSTVIYDLFIRLMFYRQGTIRWGIHYKRSSFTRNQLYSMYIHSHCPSLTLNRPDEWKCVCTGSGPIGGTMSKMSISNYPLEYVYGFIAELRQIIRVESLQGGPYMHLDRISGPYAKVTDLTLLRGDASSLTHITNYKALIKSYIKSGRLKLGYINSCFCLGCTFVEWLIDFTQYAQAWGEKNSINIPVERVLIKDNTLCTQLDTYWSENDINRALGKPVITFKGTEYVLKMIDSDSNTEQRLLIDPMAAAKLIKAILDTLNYRYGKYETKGHATSNIVFS